jgi:hypothetical protein
LEACNRFAIGVKTTVFSYDSLVDLANGSTLYDEFTIPLTNTAPAGWYSDGTNVWVSAGGGVLYGEILCLAPTPTPTPTATLPPGVGFARYTGATYASKTLACADSNYLPITTMYLNNDTNPQVGDVFYTDQACTIPFDGNKLIYQVWRGSPSTNKWGIEIGELGTILSITDCSTVPTPTVTPTPTATPAPIYTISLGYSTLSYLQACSRYDASDRVTVWSNTPSGSLVNGSVLYSTFTDPLAPPYAPNGWYSNGTATFEVTGGLGEITLSNPTGCS